MANQITDTTGKKPLSMVMKVVEANGRPVVKLSDCPEKVMCEDKEYINYVKRVYNYIPLDEYKGTM